MNFIREDIFGEETKATQIDLVKSVEINQTVNGNENENQKPNKKKIDVIIPSVPAQTGPSGNSDI